MYKKTGDNWTLVNCNSEYAMIGMPLINRSPELIKKTSNINTYPGPSPPLFLAFDCRCECLQVIRVKQFSTGTHDQNMNNQIASVQLCV